MMKLQSIFKFLLVAGIAFTAVACESYRNEHMEEYQTMSYFRNGGEQSIALYRTGEDGFYTLSICKGGRDLEGTITLELIPLDEDRMALYNAANYTTYTAIPQYLFEFYEDDETTVIKDNPLVLSFAPNEAYKTVKVRMQTNYIKALMDSYPDREYVMGFQLFSAEGKISDDINILILKPEISIPYLMFSNPGVAAYTYDKNSSKENVYSNRVKFEIDRNRWDFDCTLEVKDAAWLRSYNAAHGTDYELLPRSNYSMPSTLHFEKGVMEKEFSVTVNRQDMPALHNYVIPIAVGRASKDEFVAWESDDANEYIYMLQVLMTPDQREIQESQLSAFYEGKEGFSIANLVDGDTGTYWASPGSARYGGWAGDAEWGFYFDINLESQISAFVLGYHPSNNAVRCPTRIKLGVSNDGVNWTLVADVATTDMRNLRTWHDLPLVKLDYKFRYIRMGLLETYINDTVQPLNIDAVDMTCEVSELRLYADAN